MNLSKQNYRLLCESEESIPLFSQAWWLDAVAGEAGWDVAVVEHNGEIVAAMPYARFHRFGRTVLGHPPLTQVLGPWIKEFDAKNYARLARQKDLMQALIEQLPKYTSFRANWHFTQMNWMPFFWAGFNQTTRYTYRLSDLSDEDKIWSGLRENIRREIRKAKSRFGVKVRTDLGLDTFLALNAKTFARQGKKVPYSEKIVSRLDVACQTRKSRKIFIAQDGQGQAHAGVYLVWDKNSAYYLMGGGEPLLRNSGATSLCMWEAIKFARTVTKSFDFEGSMIEPVERFFRAFGAEQTPYFSISHTPSKLTRAVMLARNIWN